MDDFPEAFNKRFRKDVDVHEIKSFQQLKLSFQMWAGKKAPMTRLQTRALSIEADKLDIAPVKRAIIYKKGKPVRVWKNIITGRFAKPPS